VNSLRLWYKSSSGIDCLVVLRTLAKWLIMPGPVAFREVGTDARGKLAGAQRKEDEFLIRESPSSKP
jgi:hypothetical protein